MNAATHWAIRAIAIGVAVASPIVLLADRAPRTTAMSQPLVPQSIPVARATPEATAIGALFAMAEPAADLSDRPALVGIAGRLPDDAEAIVRTPEGQTKVIRRGDTAIGWTLIAIAADRAVFAKGGEQHVSTLAPIE